MRIAVCDDNQIFLEEMKIQLHRQGMDDVHTYFEVEQFFDDVKEEFDLVFLDIDWGEIKETGLDFGEKLYELMPHVPIVLVTGYNDRFAQHVLLSEMNLIGYMTKPIDVKVLEKYLHKAKGKSKRVQYLNVSIQGETVRLRTDEIVHIESHNHLIQIYTEDEMFTVYEKLNDVIKRLPKEFLQCHKSFVVNLDKASSIDGKSILLQNGKVIPISRSFQTDARRRFFKHIGAGI